MDDNKTNPGVGAGFMADILKDLQKQYGIDKKPKGKGKRGNASKKPSEPKGKPCAQGSCGHSGLPQQLRRRYTLDFGQMEYVPQGQVEFVPVSPE